MSWEDFAEFGQPAGTVQGFDPSRGESTSAMQSQQAASEAAAVAAAAQQAVQQAQAQQQAKDLREFLTQRFPSVDTYSAKKQLPGSFYGALGWGDLFPDTDTGVSPRDPDQMRAAIESLTPQTVPCTCQPAALPGYNPATPGTLTD